ncbi:MAG: prepilin-type N-terminal cleavage/methylation domain-containing protein [Phycisphaerae bacterium]|jgi:prepilin-type N-terminal cleavage/methylation domain-containing protein
MKKTITQSGFTLVELAVVIVIIGVLAAFAVPRFRASVERSKAAESFNYLSAIQAAQERYHAKQGTYAADTNDLDIQFSAPKYFSVGEVQGESLETTWSLTLTRSGNAAGYGEYTVTFTEQGYDAENSTISTLDDINPLQT